MSEVGELVHILTLRGRVADPGALRDRCADLGALHTLTLLNRVADLGALKDRVKDLDLELGWETGAPLILRNRVTDQKRYKDRVKDPDLKLGWLTGTHTTVLESDHFS